MVPARVEEIPCQVIIDSGAGISIIGGPFYRSFLLSKKLVGSNSDHVAVAVNGESMTIRGILLAKVKLGDTEATHNFRVIDEIEDDIIIGTDLLKKLAATVDFGHETLTISPSKPIQGSLSIGERLPKIAIVDDIVLAPRSRTYANVRSDIDLGRMPHVVETSPSVLLQRKAFVRKGLADSQDFIVELVNSTSKSVKLYSGCTVAFAIPISKVGTVETSERETD